MSRLVTISVITGSLIAAGIFPSAADDLPMCTAGQTDCFTGKLTMDDIPLDEDGNSKILKSDFGFVDSAGIGWQTNAGDKTNGASIPPALQRIVGQPFDRLFVPAAVIHDRYCDKEKKRRVHPWKTTHRMFYQALLATGLSRSKARLMYYAVYTFGPRWDEVDIGQVCRGNLTPLCQQVIDTDSPPPQTDDPKPAIEEKPEDLLKIYDVSAAENGQVDLFRSEIYDVPSVQEDLKAAEIVLNATYSTADSEQNTPNQEMDFIELLSDTRHPAESILLNTREPNPRQPNEQPLQQK